MKYTLSTDYEKLYEEMQDGNPVAAFVDYDYMGRDKAEKACRDICQVKRKGQYDIDFFVRGMSYMGIYPYLKKEYGLSEKEVFINSCKSINLEWIDRGIELADELRKLRKHEYICNQCGIRKDSENEKADF